MSISDTQHSLSSFISFFSLNLPFSSPISFGSSLSQQDRKVHSDNDYVDDDDDGRRIPFGNLAKTSPLGTRQGRSFFHLTTVPIIGIPKPPIVGNYNCKLFIVVNYNQRVFIRLANGIELAGRYPMVDGFISVRLSSG